MSAASALPSPESTTPPQILLGHKFAPAYSYPSPNVPGKSLVALVVDYEPGAKTPPHRHGSTFVVAYVLSGAVRSQVNDEEVKVYHAGESWSEAPGVYHNVSENASATEPAKFIATFLVDSDYKELVTFDCEACKIAKDVLSVEGKKNQLEG
ncbi:hypothetical protein BOTBODRAFT_35118 [Botryobasidium botryosum FD-172 SS1]|uniref:Cupin type-2 domain-containing protein n=1 Tax=Botryobasidium botryosum (strain FD-172 SS1) TaxID=930990 RepID=A0A067M7Y9_BOTB1|nr:hypothetical protein BOTBODRAFT_35118 [Botryobasidium botryosum FD-172 SS1]